MHLSSVHRHSRLPGVWTAGSGVHPGAVRGNLKPMQMVAVALRSAVFTARLRSHHPVIVNGLTRILVTGGQIEFGGDVVFRALSARSEVGASRGGTLVIEDNVFIKQGVTVIATHSIRIGHHTLIGGHTGILDSSFHAIEADREPETGPIGIGSNVWIARSVVVLPGVTIGDGSVAAAGSIVSKDIPPAVLAAGALAKPVRDLVIPDGWYRP